jgi:hypothetical protein
MFRGFRRGIVIGSLVLSGFGGDFFAFPGRASAETISQTGNGGSPGGNGQSVSLTLTDSGDPSNSVTTVGGGAGPDDQFGDVGFGGSATSIDTENYAGPGDLNDQVFATGGVGGSSSLSYNSGTPGGAATATESATNSAGAVTASSTSTGGQGGNVNVPAIGDGGAGGNATSTTTAQSTFAGAAVTAASTATGGEGGAVPPLGGGYGSGGTATATAIGSGSGQTLSTAVATGGFTGSDGAPGIALANAQALGTSGSATATASEDNVGTFSFGSGPQAQITSTASGLTQGKNTSVFAWASNIVPGFDAQLLPPSQSSLGAYQAAVIDLAFPSTTVLNTPLASAPLVNNDFDTDPFDGAPGPESTVLGLVTLGGGSDGDGLQHTWSTSTTFTSPDPLNQQHLILGLLDPTSTGNGFDSLTFTMTENSDVVLQQETFITLAAADAYFTDNPIDLGPTANVLSIEFSMSVTTTSPGDSFYASLVYGEATVNSNYVPEPSSTTFVLFLAGGTILRRRRREKYH